MPNIKDRIVVVTLAKYSVSELLVEFVYQGVSELLQLIPKPFPGGKSPLVALGA